MQRLFLQQGLPAAPSPKFFLRAPSLTPGVHGIADACMVGEHVGPLARAELDLGLWPAMGSDACRSGCLERKGAEHFVEPAARSAQYGDVATLLT